jgi:hypothetical protein
VFLAGPCFRQLLAQVILYNLAGLCLLLGGLRSASFEFLAGSGLGCKLGRVGPGLGLQVGLGGRVGGWVRG